MNVNLVSALSEWASRAWVAPVEGEQWRVDVARAVKQIRRRVDERLRGAAHCALVQNGVMHHARVLPLAQVVWSGNPREPRTNYGGQKGISAGDLAKIWRERPAHTRGVWLGTDHFLRELGPDAKTPRRWTTDAYRTTANAQFGATNRDAAVNAGSASRAGKDDSASAPAEVFALWSSEWCIWAARRWESWVADLARGGLSSIADQAGLVRVVDDEWTARRNEVVNEAEWGPGAWERLASDPRLVDVFDACGFDGSEAERFIREFPRMRMESDQRHWRWVSVTQALHAQAWRQTTGPGRTGCVNFHGVSQWMYPCGRAEVPWLSPGGAGCVAGTHQVVKLYFDTPAARLFCPQAGANVEGSDDRWKRWLVAQQGLAGALASNEAPLWVVLQNSGAAPGELTREAWLHAALRSGEPLLVSQEGGLAANAQAEFALALGEACEELDRVTGGYGYEVEVASPLEAWDVDEMTTTVRLPEGGELSRVTRCDGRGQWIGG